MNDQIETCYAQFVPMSEPVQYLAQICYASVPGWCCHARCYVPEWYYDNGCFVGPCFNAAYSGSGRVPVCDAYYDHGSHFYCGATTTSPTPSTRTTAPDWHSAMPTGSGITVTGTTRWRTTGSCISPDTTR